MLAYLYNRADSGLCVRLAYWTGKDAHLMDALFRQSALMRDKWDEVHSGSGLTYGEMTIQWAIKSTEKSYRWPKRSTLPEVELNGDADTLDTLTAALVTANATCPRYFLVEGLPMRLKTTGVDRPVYEPLTVDMVVAELARYVQPVRVTQQGRRPVLLPPE